MSDLDLLRSLTDRIVPPPVSQLRETARRRDRRAAATATAFVAAAVVAGVLGISQLDTKDDSGPTPPTRHPELHPLTYAEGSTVHYGDASVTMPASVAELDLTDDGVVVRTSDGGIWLTDGTSPVQIGTLGSPSDLFRPELEYFYGDGSFVVSNNRGSVAAWLEFRMPDQPELVVFDTESREEAVRRPVSVQPGSGILLTAVDAQYAYWEVDHVPFEDSPAGRMDLTTGEQMVSPPAPEFEGTVLPEGMPRTFLISHREGGGGPYEVDEGIHSQFGFQGRRIVMRGEEPLEALDGATREPLTFSPPAGFENPDPTPGWVTQWIDDESFVLAYRAHDTVTLLVCRIPTQSCEVALPPVPAVLPEIG